MSAIGKLKTGKLNKVNIVEVKIVKKVADECYIVSDGSDHILLESPQKLTEGMTYKLIKPSYGDGKLSRNSKFAAIKSEKEIHPKDLKPNEEKKLLENMGNSSKPEVVNNFELVNNLGAGNSCGEIVLLVVSKSSVIEGKFGTYRIITCKDIKNQKNSINLYKNLQNSVTVGDLYKFTSLKVNNFKKEDQDFNRLGTTNASRILNVGTKEKVEFEKAGVKLGDNEIKGVIIGISELNMYESCIKCWCKVDQDDYCRKCNKKVEMKKMDFNVNLYIQNEDDETDIKDMFSFKSTLSLAGGNEGDITEDSLNSDLVGKKCVAQYNIDKSTDDEKLKLVKILMN